MIADTPSKLLVCVVSIHVGGSIRICDLARGTVRPLTDDQGLEYWGIWSADGRHIVFNSDRYGGQSFSLYRKPVDGSGREERLAEASGHQQPCSWTPDGRFLLFTQAGGPATGQDIWRLPMEGDPSPEAIVNTRSGDMHPAVSPNGRWLAYSSRQSGQNELYLRSFPELG